MRNLLLFIWKNYFFFLFLLLEFISISLIVNNNFYQRASFINSANYISGSLLESYSSLTDFFSLKEVNEQLARENAQLLSSNRFGIINPVYTIITATDTVLKQKYDYISAKVVGNTTNRRNNYITLDVGYNQGITADMGVISSTGVIGIVKNASANFSSVMSLLNGKTVVSCKLEKQGSFGPLTWDGDDYTVATLKDIPTHIIISKGDKVVTSAYSSTYPENIMIGTVESFEKSKGDNFYSVKVKLATDFKKLGYVYVVKNIMKGEQDTIEQIQKDDK